MRFVIIAPATSFLQVSVFHKLALVFLDKRIIITLLLKALRFFEPTRQIYLLAFSIMDLF
jgi:hypothetical protein